MKKISMIAAIAAFSLSFVACGGGADANKANNADSTAVETVTTTETVAVDSISPDSVAVAAVETVSAN